MAFDYKKEYKEYYMPKNKPAIVHIPKMNYIAIYGKGDPNKEDGEYQKALQILYPLAYTLKMSYKPAYKIEGFFEYVGPPLEGFWWQEDIHGYDASKKDQFQWISMIRLPDFIKEEDFLWAKEEVKRKKNIDCTNAQFLTIEEGCCVQMMHIGSYDEEVSSIAVMDAYIKEAGYTNDFSEERRHHEIYVSDPRKTAPEKRKTVLRHPIRKT